MNNYSNPSPPSISLTPSNEQPSVRSRSRAGTLPSSFLSSNGVLNQLGAHSNSNSPLVTGQGYDASGLSSLDSFSLGLLASSSPNAIDIPNGSVGANNSGNNQTAVRRMRSGSFFSTNSIWNDDAVYSPGKSNGLIDNVQSYDSANLNNAGSASSSSSVFLSPILTAQPSGNLTQSQQLPPSNRNRSYTTTGAPMIGVLPMSTNSYSNMDSYQTNRLSTSPFVNSSHKGNDMNSLLDNLMYNMNPSPSSGTNPPNSRIRSQTFSGSTPTISEATIQQPIAGQFQNQPSHLQLPSATQAPRAPQHPHFVPSQSQQQPQQPILFDDFDFSQLVITTNFENPNLGPTKFILFDNLPQFIDSLKLWTILNNSFGNRRSLGNIRSVRVATTTSSKLALVECSSVDIAMGLKANFNHMELVPGVILYVAFAKFGENSHSEAPPPAPVPSTNHNGASSSQSSNTPSKSNIVLNETAKASSTELSSIQDSLIQSITVLISRSNTTDIKKIISMINKSIAYPNENYQNDFGPLPDPIPLRQFDSPKLRELRKILENNENSLLNGNEPLNKTSVNIETDSSETTKVLTQLELEELCLAMLDELPELCYDYLGNTIIQKIFTLVKSPLIKLMMVKEIAPYLTQLSIHKNGTWAIQKIINLCHSDAQQKYLIGASLKPYAVKLFNDQFGNYVLQGCIKFGSPFNDFIFETMLDNFLEISFGRFGARCIRTILEAANDSNIITNEQVILVAGLIVEFANELVVNNNGSLLITWFLDTFNDTGSTIDDRFELLTQKFLPNLVKLSTHKLANLTILKILNNRSDFKLKQVIMDSIFGKFDEDLLPDDERDNAVRPPSRLLEQILTENQENSAGPLFIYKILSNPLTLTLSDESPNGRKYSDGQSQGRNARYQSFIISQIRRILLELNINNLQPYKKLMDEVGLSSNRLNRSSSIGSRRNRRNMNGNRGGHAGNNKGPQSGHSPQLMHQIPPYASNGMDYYNGNLAPQYYSNQQSYPPKMTGNGLNQNQGQNPIQYQQPQYGQPLGNVNQYPVESNPVAPSGIPAHLQQRQQYDPQDMTVMQQLEQLSLSSAAMGYNSNPGTPEVSSNQRNLFF